MVRGQQRKLRDRHGAHGAAAPDDETADAGSRPPACSDREAGARLHRVRLPDHERKLEPGAANRIQVRTDRGERKPALCGHRSQPRALARTAVVRGVVLPTRRHGEPHQRTVLLVCRAGERRDDLRQSATRLYFSAMAYVLLEGVRRLGLKGTEMAHAQVATIRLRLLKIGAQIRITARKIWVAMASSYPYQLLFQRAYQQLLA